MRVVRTAFALVLLAVTACSTAEEDSARAQAEISAMLEEYLPVLARAYTERAPLQLREWVAEKEIARVHKRIEELADQGRRLEPVFHSVTIEDVEVWGNANAYVTTVEVWDVSSVAIGTEAVVQHAEKQSNRVRYQLKRSDGRWRVLFRTIAE